MMGLVNVVIAAGGSTGAIGSGLLDLLQDHSEITSDVNT